MVPESLNIELSSSITTNSSISLLYRIKKNLVQSCYIILVASNKGISGELKDNQHSSLNKSKATEVKAVSPTWQSTVTNYWLSN
jgi:hypothetical protein